MEAHRFRQIIVVIALTLAALTLTGSASTARADTMTSDLPVLAIVATQTGGAYTVYSGYWTTTTSPYSYDIALSSGKMMRVLRDVSYGDIVVGVIGFLMLAFGGLYFIYRVVMRWVFP